MHARLVASYVLYYIKLSNVLQEGYWAHDISFGSVNGTLQYYPCPPGYCRCSSNDKCYSIYYYDDNDLQCVCDRQGGIILYSYICVYIKCIHVAISFINVHVYWYIADHWLVYTISVTCS